MPVPILAAVRSPFAVADGALAGWHPVDLAAEVAAVAVERAAVDPGAIDGVWVGCDEPVGAQGANVARAVVLAAGWPETIVGTVVEAAPHSGMSALAAACDAISAGRVGTAHSSPPPPEAAGPPGSKGNTKADDVGDLAEVIDGLFSQDVGKRRKRSPAKT